MSVKNGLQLDKRDVIDDSLRCSRATRHPRIT